MLQQPGGNKLANGYGRTPSRRFAALTKGSGSLGGEISHRQLLESTQCNPQIVKDRLDVPACAAACFSRRSRTRFRAGGCGQSPRFAGSRIIVGQVAPRCRRRTTLRTRGPRREANGGGPILRQRYPPHRGVVGGFDLLGQGGCAAGTSPAADWRRRRRRRSVPRPPIGAVYDPRTRLPGRIGGRQARSVVGIGGRAKGRFGLRRSTAEADDAARPRDPTQ